LAAELPPARFCVAKVWQLRCLGACSASLTHFATLVLVLSIAEHEHERSKVRERSNCSASAQLLLSFAEQEQEHAQAPRPVGSQAEQLLRKVSAPTGT